MKTKITTTPPNEMTGSINFKCLMKMIDKMTDMLIALIHLLSVIYVHIYIYVYIVYVRLYVYVYVFIYTCKCVYICIYTYMYICFMLYTVMVHLNI